MSFFDFSSELQRRVFGASVDDLRKLVAAQRNELADLKVSLNRLEAELRKIREALAESHGKERAIEDLSLDEVLALHKGCHDALERFEIHGGGARSLREAAATSGAELDTIVATIKNLLKDKAA